MAIQTKEYDKFKLRTDNRDKISEAHVNRLAESIKSRNLLELCPIVVNPDFEILDGQHRYLAARKLQIPIWYIVDKKLKSNDIILMNIAKPWGISDFLNYYVKNGFIEYQKLVKFMTKHNITIKIALNIIDRASGKKNAMSEFKNGKFVFNEHISEETTTLCWDTVNLIKKFNGHSPYTKTAAFWKAMIKMTKHVEFNGDKWFINLSRMIERIGPRATSDDYYKLLLEIFNWKNTNKISNMD